ncbi:hypothetical protein CGRA01v4_06962 [Colletotrichum graminicola]|uniref:Uncharacterized protein n=1 Tax=Colletotrichum graminicola (strain M1.001 / M2 / FGSC 10212) TaxID=645133 RepID=E3QR33_COLGM|nr:uncharacterized protein GLRG_08465 [Colletotrichum graminicola M1.001]EFQ33321.1 hypothetical protein GLRG_08465 [Colletotrichum graminicola M1.001]WDK15681.1 hypothetical protein CGRA01v4_06962 [Colletotrichum graminicola]
MDSAHEVRILADRLIDLELDNTRARSRHVPCHQYNPWSSNGGGIHISHELGGCIFLPSDVSTPLPKNAQDLHETIGVRHNDLQSSIQSLSDHQLLALHDLLDKEIDDYASDDEALTLGGGIFGSVGTERPKVVPQSIRNGLWVKEKAQQVAQIRLSTFRASPLLASECFNVVLIHLDMTGRVVSEESTWPNWANFEGFTKRIERNYVSLSGLKGDYLARVQQHYLLRIDRVVRSQPNPPQRAAATLYQNWLRDLDMQKDIWEHFKELDSTYVFAKMKTEGRVEGKSIAMAKLWQIKLRKLLPDIRRLEGRVPLETPALDDAETAFSIGLLLEEPIDSSQLASVVEQTKDCKHEDIMEED